MVRFFRRQRVGFRLDDRHAAAVIFEIGEPARCGNHRSPPEKPSITSIQPARSATPKRPGLKRIRPSTTVQAPAPWATERRRPAATPRLFRARADRRFGLFAERQTRRPLIEANIDSALFGHSIAFAPDARDLAANGRPAIERNDTSAGSPTTAIPLSLIDENRHPDRRWIGKLENRRADIDRGTSFQFPADDIAIDRTGDVCFRVPGSRRGERRNSSSDVLRYRLQGDFLRRHVLGRRFTQSLGTASSASADLAALSRSSRSICATKSVAANLRQRSALAWASNWLERALAIAASAAASPACARTQRRLLRQQAQLDALRFAAARSTSAVNSEFSNLTNSWLVRTTSP